MAQAGVSLPDGFRLARFDQLDSTMSEAARQAEAGEGGPLWIWALAQSGGRGRSGREWVSIEGNLFASLLLRLACPPQIALQLSLVAGIAIHDAVGTIAPDLVRREELALKWPNDLLLSEKKIAGLLLESFEVTAQQERAIIIGTGLNLTSHPAETLHPASDLAAFGITLEPAAALEALAVSTARWLEVWDTGNGFQAVRQAWMARALPEGTQLRMRLDGEEVIGAYAGIGKDGALRLVDASGSERLITAGDVFLNRRARSN